MPVKRLKTADLSLDSSKAIELWISGRSNWNSWVKKNPKASINFDGVDFSKLQSDTNKIIDFSGFIFPLEGNVTFFKANFGDSIVNFNLAIFGRGFLCFDYAKFGDGNVFFEFTEFNCRKLSFKNAIFGRGNVVFKKSKFTECDILFNNTDFGSGDNLFIDVDFSGGMCSFEGVRFGSGTTSFYNSKFNCECVDFSEVEFLDSDALFTLVSFNCKEVHFSRMKNTGRNISFVGTVFDVDFVYFRHVIFNCNEVSFYRASFRNVYFCSSSFECELVSFESVNFSGILSITDLLTNDRTNLSFKLAIFGKSVELNNIGVLASAPDFTGTKFNSHVDVSDFKYFSSKRSRNCNVDYFEEAKKLCRLKEISETNKDHQAVLRYHSDERRAKRWSGSIKNFSKIIDVFFDYASEYGQSISKPALGFLFTVILMTLYTVGYCMPFNFNPEVWIGWFGNMYEIKMSRWIDGALYSLVNLLPFIGGMQEYIKPLKESLRPILSENHSLVSVFFSISSYIWIFLISLGVKNRFRF
jgi:hypothetical protein